MAVQFEKQVSETDIPPIQEAKEFDVEKEREQIALAVQHSAELEEMTGQINPYQPLTIAEYGKPAAEAIARCSDQVLQSVDMAKISETGTMLNTLNDIMKQFDINELKEEKKGLLGKLFGSIEKQLERILAKYNTVGAKIDKVYVELKKYELEIAASNGELEKMFVANVDYFKELVKYIVAGEQALGELDCVIKNMEEKGEQQDDSQFDLQTLRQSREMLEHRVLDLKMAQMVAMQSIPMIRNTQNNNYQLTRQINSAFIITLPVFKNGIIQAIELKRQKVQAEAMQSLRDTTNKLLEQNAQNMAKQSASIAQMATTGAIDIAALERSHQAIIEGINTTKQIYETASAKRQEDTKRLEALQKDFIEKARTM